AQALRHQFLSYANVDSAGYADLQGREFDIVINATSASLQGEVPPLPSAVFAKGSLAYDMMYGAGPTPFMEFSQREGAAFQVDGVGMLVEQAAESFFLWRGVWPETAPVIEKLRS